MTKAQVGRRRLDASVPSQYEIPVRQPRLASRRWATVLKIATGLAWLLASLAAATCVVAVGAPSWLWRPAAGVLLVVFAAVLAHRVGARMRLWVPLVALLAIAANVSDREAVLAAAAGATATLAAVVAVLHTVPAQSLLAVLREFVIALVIALTGAVAVAAWHADVNVRNFGIWVMAAALALMLATVWALGSGLHGLGRTHLYVVAAIAVIVVLIFFYGGYLRSNASEWFTNLIEETIVWFRQNTGGVPRPFEFLVGFPALIVGTAMRSRHREGWWIGAFGVVGTCVMTVALVDPAAYPSYFLASTGYSAILGLVLGLVLRQLFVLPRSVAAKRVVIDQARSEPGRFAPLK